jgi:hypothetical protein
MANLNSIKKNTYMEDWKVSFMDLSKSLIEIYSDEFIQVEEEYINLFKKIC